MTASLTPTEELILSNLAARWRLGESIWTFDFRLKKSLTSLQSKGYINFKNGVVEKTYLAWFTQLGYKEQFPANSIYVPPIFRKLGKKALAEVKAATPDEANLLP